MQWRDTWLNLSLRTKCLLLISLPAAATVALAGAFYLLGTETRAASQQLNNSRIVANALEQLRTSEIEASAHVRGYLITAEEPFAVKARAALAAFDQAWQKVSGLTAGDGAQTERMARIALVERARVERIFGDTARFRKHTLPASQLAPAVNAAEDERLRLERILETVEQANTQKVEANLARLQWLRDQQNTVSAICVFLGLAGGLAMTLLFAQGITGRIARLQTNMAKLAAGESLDALPGWDEIGALQNGLVRIEHVIQQQRATLENARDGIAEVDAEGRYRWWNEAYAKIAGLSEVYRPRSIQASLPSEMRPKLQAAIESMRQSGRTELTARMEPPGDPGIAVDLTLLAGPGLADAGFYIFLRMAAGEASEDAGLRAQDAAAASNRAKNDFLAKISHDIRTPLNAILGAADLLSQTTLTFDQSGYVHMFQRNCRRLLALINDFLDFSRIEAGAVQIENAPFQLREIVGDAVATFREAAAHKGIGLGMEIDPRTPEWLNGDSLRIQQVLVNLLSNALKFTTEGRVDVRAKAWQPAGTHGLRLLCEVVDSGPGIPARDQDRIFLKFTQLPNQTAGQRGTGLGLTICRDLVGLLGGEIEVSSPPGGGSNFHFTIPIEAAENGSAAGSGAAAEPALDELVTSNVTIRILVAEDTEDNRLLVEHYLRPEPVELRFAFNGQEALEVIQRGERLDLILMDIDMPVMDGYEATRAIRAWESGRGEATPIVALSADAMSEAVRLSLEAGCVAHVAKPIDRVTLVTAIQRHARRRSLRAGQAPRTVPVSQEVQALVPQYLASKTKQIAEARDCLTARDFGPIRRFGHNLKGTGSGYGFPDIEEMGRNIERAAVEADIDRIGEQLDALHRFVSETGAAVHPS
jgi:signal transduction histidine kinase/DNA-binding response OmpR family regulator